MKKISKRKLFYSVLVFFIFPLIVGIILKYFPSSEGNETGQIMIDSSNSIQAGRDINIENFNTIEDKSKNNASKTKKRISSLTLPEIYDTINKTLPLQRDEIRKSFEKIRVSWDVYLSGARMKDNNKAYLFLRPINGVPKRMGVGCEVSLEEYPELAILPEKTKMNITGDILMVETLFVELTNIDIVFLENKSPDKKVQ